MREQKHTGYNNRQMNLQELITAIVQVHGWKAVLALIGAFIFNSLLPIAPFIAVGVGLVVSDFVTGITAAYVTGTGITSRRMARSVGKIVFYSLAIILAHAVEVVFFPGTNTLVYLVAVYIAITELYSNLENIGRITGTDILGVVRGVLDSRLKIAKRKEDADSDDSSTHPQN